MAENPAVGRMYGPVTVAPVEAHVRAFVEATGDDPERWTEVAPPGYAAVALFAIAPMLLADAEVAPASASVIHTDQRFTWHDDWAIGAPVSVDGVVVKARSRGELLATSLEIAVTGPSGPILSSLSSFLFSTAEIAASVERPEPHHEAVGADDGSPAALPFRKSASRADLVRYAAATGDWNPIHWDHDAARAAGLPGVVCHGLLLTSWILQASLGRRISEAAVRFRSPVLAGESVTIDLKGDVDRSSVSLSVGGEDRVTGYLKFGDR